MVPCSLTTLSFSALFSLIIVFKWLMSNKLIFIVIVTPQIQGRQRGAYLGATEEMLCSNINSARVRRVYRGNLRWVCAHYFVIVS